MTLAVAEIAWKPCWRIIPSRFPPIALFERVTDPDDLDAIMELEALTNPRLRDEVGDIRLVPPDERISGPGTSIIMAAFTHLNRAGSRFSDGTYGVFYAAKDMATAIAETKYHRERFMRATQQAHMQLDMRVYATDLDGELHDLRGQKTAQPLVYDKDSYAASQHLARRLRKAGSNGIVYDSVRHQDDQHQDSHHQDGQCVAVFRPRLLSHCRQERHLCYVWDGNRITDIYEKRELGNSGVQ